MLTHSSRDTTDPPVARGPGTASAESPPAAFSSDDLADLVPVVVVVDDRRREVVLNEHNRTGISGTDHAIWRMNHKILVTVRASPHRCQFYTDGESIMTTLEDC